MPVATMLMPSDTCRVSAISSVDAPSSRATSTRAPSYTRSISSITSFDSVPYSSMCRAIRTTSSVTGVGFGP